MDRRAAVLIFKSETNSSNLYGDGLEQYGFNPIFVPTLCFGFTNLALFREKLMSPNKYSGMILTSPRCIDAMNEALKQESLPISWRNLHNYSVGAVTYNKAMNMSRQLYTYGKQTGNVRNLADFIIETFNGPRHLPLLMPCGNLRNDYLFEKLNANGLKVDIIEVYETTCNPGLRASVERAICEQNVQFMVFFSPSGVICAHDYFDRCDFSLRPWKLIAIGPSTTRALKDRGVRAIWTAERPSVQHLVCALQKAAKYCNNKYSNRPAHTSSRMVYQHVQPRIVEKPRMIVKQIKSGTLLAVPNNLCGNNEQQENDPKGAGGDAGNVKPTI